MKTSAEAIDGATQDGRSASGGGTIRRIRPVLRVLVPLLGFGFIGWQAYGQTDVIGALEWHPGWKTVAAVPCIMLGHTIGGAITYFCLRRLGASPPWRAVVRIHLLSQAAKYLPAGGFFNVTAQTVALGRLKGVGVLGAVGAICCMMATGCASAIAWYGLTLLIAGTRPIAFALAALAVFPLWLACLRSPRAWDWVIRRLEQRYRTGAVPGEPNGLPSADYTLVTALLGLAALGLHGLSLALVAAQLVPLSPGTALQLVGVMGASWFLGLISVVAPAGMGVRDAAMVILLRPILGDPLSILVPVISRLLWIIADLCNLVVGAVVLRPRPAPPEPSP